MKRLESIQSEIALIWLLTLVLAGCTGALVERAYWEAVLVMGAFTLMGLLVPIVVLLVGIMSELERKSGK